MQQAVTETGMGAIKPLALGRVWQIPPSEYSSNGNFLRPSMQRSQDSSQEGPAMTPYEATRSDTGTTEAAAVISRLLAELACVGIVEGSPAALAKQALDRAWRWNVDLLEGASGPKPHEMTIAATALALAVLHQAHRQNETMQGVYFLALGMILDEIAGNASTYSFHDVDVRLLDAAAATFSAPAEELHRSPGLEWHGL
jgi:hypothetical protein